VVSAVPDVFTLTVALIHVELPFIVPIFEDHAAEPMLIAFGPIAFIKIAALQTNTVAESVSFIGQVAPLPLVVVPCGRLGQLPKRAPMEVHKRHRTVVKMIEALVECAQPGRCLLAAFESIKVNREVNLRFFGLKDVAETHRVAVVQK